MLVRFCALMHNGTENSSKKTATKKVYVFRSVINVKSKPGALHDTKFTGPLLFSLQRETSRQLLMLARNNVAVLHRVHVLRVESCSLSFLYLRFLYFSPNMSETLPITC